MQHGEVLVHAVQLGLQNLLLHFRRLGNHAELLVRENHGVPVVVLDEVEDALAVLGREILLAGIEHLRIRISRAERAGDLVDVGFQPDDKRFVGQSEAFLLVGSAAHDEGLAAAHLVVDDAAAEHLVHPDGILLTAVEIGNAQPFQIKVGERLVRAVVLRPHEAVERAVVEVGEPILEVGRLLAQPVGKGVAYLVDLAVGELYGLAVAHFDLFQLPVYELRYLLGDVGRGILQGVLQQMDAVVFAALRIDGILVQNLRVQRGGLDAVFVDVGGIAHLDFRIEQRGGELFIDAFGYPPLAEVEVEVIESNGLRGRRPQCFERLPYRLVVGVLIQKGLHPVGFLDDVACDELVGDLVEVDEGIEVNAPFQFFEHLRLRSSRERSHVLQVDPPIFVQTGDQCLVRIFGMGDLVGVESYGMVENIGFAGLAVDVAFKRQHLRSPRIHLDEVEVAFVVEPTETLREVIVKPVEHLAQGGILRLCLRLVVVEVEIGVAYLDVERGFRALCR